MKRKSYNFLKSMLLLILAGVVLIRLMVHIEGVNDTFFLVLILCLTVLIAIIHLLNTRLSKEVEFNMMKYSALVNVLPDMIFIYSKEGVFLDYQASNDTKLLYDRDYFIGKHMNEVMPDRITKKALESIKKALVTGEVITFEYQLTIDEKKKHFETRMVNHTDSSVLAIVRDITEAKNRRMLIEELSFKDQLTKVYNRRYFDEKMEEFNEESYLPLAIIMIDVNGLKLTNDAFGHIAGDELLVKVADKLQSMSLGEDGFVARIGGDEFVIVMPNKNENEIYEFVEVLKGNLAQEKVVEIPVSVSIGWEIRLELDTTWNEVFIAAEDEMFRTKLTESRSLRHNVISVIMNSLNTKNHRERLHSECVSKLSKMIAIYMKLSDEVIREIETAGLLHDIGKIGIRQEILDKKGPLSEKEYDEIKKHPESGYQILRSVDSYASFANIVLSHHERVDGKGYPRGLKGEEIPIEARIIMVADAYEAMRADRSYRMGMTHKDAVDELIKCSGTQFDKEVVKAFIENFNVLEYGVICE